MTNEPSRRITRLWQSVIVIVVAVAMVCVVVWIARRPQQKSPVDPRRVNDNSKLPFPASINGYRFANAALADRAKQFDAIARQEYVDLHHDNYDDVKAELVDDAIVARWCRHKDAKGECIGWLRRQPNRGGSIHLNKGKGGVVDRVAVIGSCYEEDGWAASVQLAMGEKDVFHLQVFHEQHLPDRIYGSAGMNIANPTFAIELKTSQEESLSLRTGLPFDRASITEHSIQSWLATPEGLRDLALEQLEALEAITLERIEAGEGFQETDWSNVSSDNPPRTWPRENGPLSAEQLHMFREKVSEFFGKRRTVIRSHYEVIFATLSRAFPYSEVSEDSLTSDPDE